MSDITPQFNGSDYDPVFDHARLSGQILRVHECMKDGVWRTLDEIARITKEMKQSQAKDGVIVNEDPQASISAQLRHLRKQKFGSYTVAKRNRGDRAHGLYEYRLTSPLKFDASTEMEERGDDGHKANIYSERQERNVKKEIETNKDSVAESGQQGDNKIVVQSEMKTIEENPIKNPEQLNLFS